MKRIERPSEELERKIAMWECDLGKLFDERVVLHPESKDFLRMIYKRKPDFADLDCLDLDNLDNVVKEEGGWCFGFKNGKSIAWVSDVANILFWRNVEESERPWSSWFNNPDRTYSTIDEFFGCDDAMFHMLKRGSVS